LIRLLAEILGIGAIFVYFRANTKAAKAARYYTTECIQIYFAQIITEDYIARSCPCLYLYSRFNAYCLKAAMVFHAM